MTDDAYLIEISRMINNIPIQETLSTTPVYHGNVVAEPRRLNNHNGNIEDAGVVIVYGNVNGNIKDCDTVVIINGNVNGKIKDCQTVAGFLADKKEKQ